MPRITTSRSSRHAAFAHLREAWGTAAPPAARRGARGSRRAPLAWWAGAFAWGYVIAAVLACAALWGLADRDGWWPATAFLFGPRWLLLLPLPVLLVAAAVFRRRLLLPLAVAGAIVVGPVMGFRVAWGSPRAPGPSAERAPRADLRVITFNAGGGNRLGMLLGDVLAELQPDVVALQECGPDLAWFVHQLRGWYVHELEALCLISRYPIDRVAKMDRRALENFQAMGVGGSGDVIRYTIRAPGRAIHFTNLHLETPRKAVENIISGSTPGRISANIFLRAIESRRARAWVDIGADASTLVAGDFNLPVESVIFRQSWGDLRDAFSEAGTGFGMTKYNGWIRVRIDHILMGSGWRAEGVFVGPDLESDHRPVVADLRWGGGT
ncbi:MAG: endonuclease/exonuclease/phosphatase family protein [Gemmatimonadaceae bacterium]